MNEGFHLIEHPLLQHKLITLRDKNTNTKDFRSCVAEITTILAYEATRDLPVCERSVETPFANMQAPDMEPGSLAAVVLLRAGLGMADGVQTLAPFVKIGHIGIYKDKETGLPVQYYSKMPTDISRRHVLLLEPMLATGETADHAIRMLENYRCPAISLITIVSVQRGIDLVLSRHPYVNIYAAAVDDKINENGYIVPGLGDIGDRMFGTK
ncbi:MAG: uracil phosphoribosyltransferase [Firmicutes bacterium]|nr:uracil phosphoribosyltransferase [Bacillota bacterium]